MDLFGKVMTGIRILKKIFAQRSDTMKRRFFLKLSTASILPFFGVSCNPGSRDSFEISVRSDMKFGHTLFEGQDYTSGPNAHTETLIVGGGVAGITAAYKLGGSDFVLCELSDTLGGTSAALDIGEGLYAQGAHYDLAYPEYYGQETLSLLQNLGLIQWNEFNRSWDFTEKQFLISKKNESRCYDNGHFRESVLPDGNTKDKFIALMQNFRGKMPLPTPAIPDDVRYLNDITFQDFLKDKITLDHTFKAGLDYNMRDDYGGPSDQVSALAGIHYYECRPYYTKPVELFSPPQGNYYFVDKMAAKIPAGNIKTNHMVFNIKDESTGFKVEVLDQNTHSVKTYYTKKIIYAGNKHALKYIYPTDAGLFSNNLYAPWMIMNIKLNQNFSTDTSFWQNEMISGHKSLIGFVDSASQYHTGKEPRILTAYFCLPHEARNDLKEVENNRFDITYAALDLISEYYGFKVDPFVEKVFIKVLGHAMAIPVPGFLFNDKNSQRNNENLVYAGVDNGRLPLFLEAIDSGIQAVKQLKKSTV